MKAASWSGSASAVELLKRGIRDMDVRNSGVDWVLKLAMSGSREGPKVLLWPPWALWAGMAVAPASSGSSSMMGMVVTAQKLLIDSVGSKDE